MELKLIRADVKDAQRLWKMQVEAFTEMYNRYQDTDTSPAAEPADRIIERHCRKPATAICMKK